MCVLGITGPIAAGKTTVMGLFADMGAMVLAADDVSRRIMKPGSDIVKRIAESFGDRYTMPDGALDRKALGRHVFSDGTALARLNAMVHPLMRDEIVRWLDGLRAEHRPERLAVVEAAVFTELGLEELVDAVLFVDADKRTRIERLMQRDQLSENDATSRVGAQEVLGFVQKNAKWVLDGSMPVEGLRACCAKIREEIRGH